MSSDKKSVKIFISYSHDSGEHKEWVRRLAIDLRENEIEVLFDQDLKLGTDIAHFMEAGIVQVDRVLMICSEKYVQKANELLGGVGYEKQIITGELFKNLKSTKFIPVVRQKKLSKVVPHFISTRIYIDFSDDREYSKYLSKLIADLKDFDSAEGVKVDRTSFSLGEYKDSFIKEHSRYSDKLVYVPCKFNGEAIVSSSIFELFKSEDRILLHGPSGCGKSMLGRAIGISLFSIDLWPIFLEAKYFEGNLLGLLDSELELLCGTSFESFAASASAASKSIVVILDAVNECPNAQEAFLLRQLRELCNKFEIKLLVSSQQNLQELGALKFKSLEIFEPDSDQKIEIAKVFRGDSLNRYTLEMLQVAKNGFEAGIIGRLSPETSSFSSRFAIFDQYVRRLLEGEFEHEGIKLLTSLGDYVNSNLRFILSSREFDRIVDENGISSPVIQKVFDSNLLNKHENKIGFGHELLLNAFCAEAVVRECRSNSDDIIEALSLPRHAAHKSLIIGAIDDPVLIEKVLNGVVDATIIRSCIFGDCGEFAKLWVEKKIKLILDKIKAECSEVKFRVSKNGWMGIEAIPDSLQDWSIHDRALVDALPSILVSGKFIDAFYKAGLVMQRTSAEAFAALISIAKEEKVALRSALFSECFDNQNSKIVFCEINAAIPLCRSFFREKNDVTLAAKWIEDKLASLELNTGEISMLINLGKDVCRHSFFPLVLDLVSNQWLRLPYHFKLQILDLSHGFHDVEPSEKNKLVEALNAVSEPNIMISTSIVDALKFLGGIEDIDYEETVRDEVNQVLAEPDDEDNWALARSLHDRQFDHPYDEAYWTVLHELPPEKRKVFLCKAIKARTEFCMFTSSIILELIDFGDSEVGEHIVHWTETPKRPNPMPQDALQVFVLAHVALGNLGSSLPAKTYNLSAEDNALNALAEIYYWINRLDIPQHVRAQNCESAWKVLHRHELGLTISTFYEFDRSYHAMLDRRVKEDISILDLFPSRLAEICRQAILNSGIQKRNYFQWGSQEDLLSHSIALLASCGDKTDIPLIKQFVDNPNVGETAIRWLKALESK